MKSLFSSFVMLFAIALGAVPAAAQMLYWDIDGQTEGAGGATPTGMWDANATNWNTDATGGAGGVITMWDGTAATFSAGGDATGTYNVTVTGTQSVSGMTFDSGSVTLNGDQLSLTGAPTTIQVDDAVAGTINSVLQGSGLIKIGNGTLALGGNSAATFTGNLDINAGGILRITDSGAFGSAGVTDVAGTPTDASIVRDGATLEIGDGVTVTDRVFISGTGVAGGGAIRKTGAGNSALAAGVRFQTTGASVIADAGTLTITQTAGTTAISKATAVTSVTFGGAGNIVVTGSPNTNLAVTSARLVKVGTGTMTLNSTSSNTEGWTINGGVLSFTSDGTTPTTVSYNLGRYPAALDADYITLDGGTLRKATASASATSFISANRGVVLGPSGGGIDYTPLTGATNTSLFVQSIGEVNSADVTTLTKYGAGEIRMSAAGQVHSFDKLVIKSGTYGIGQATTLGQDTQLGAVPGSPLADAVTMDGGILRFLGGTSATNITLDINRGITLTAAAGNAFQVEGSNVTIPGQITGPGNLTKTGALTMTLTGANTYADTNLNAGTLVVSMPSATLGGGNVKITAGTLRISSDVTNAIADTAAVNIMGGLLNLETGINDVIASLMLGGVPQVGGTYGSTSSLATFQNDSYFSGSGILTVPGVSLPGDYNGDGKVNAADYVLWRKNPNAFGGDPQGYLDWRANFGNPPGAGSGLDGGSVPEPASAVLMLLGVATVVLRRRGQR